MLETIKNCSLEELYNLKEFYYGRLASDYEFNFERIMAYLTAITEEIAARRNNG